MIVIDKREIGNKEYRLGWKNTNQYSIQASMKGSNKIVSSRAIDDVITAQALWNRVKNIAAKAEKAKYMGGK